MQVFDTTIKPFFEPQKMVVLPTMHFDASRAPIGKKGLVFDS